MKKKTIILLYGLPGVGKSTYAKSLVNTGFNRVRIIDVDKQPVYVELERKSLKYTLGDEVPVADPDITAKFAKKLAKEVMVQSADTVVIDGLVTTNAIARAIFEEIQKLSSIEPSFEIVWWEKDIEACLHNDIGRRAVSSRMSIQNMPFEEPSKELKKEFNVKTTRKTVVRKSDSMVWAETISQDGLLVSGSWCLGGTTVSYTGEKWGVSVDPTPEFKDFDELMEKICPQITFLQYKRLYNACVKVESFSEQDYYGGTTDHCKYVCDLDKLYNMLKDLNLL